MSRLITVLLLILVSLAGCTVPPEDAPSGKTDNHQETPEAKDDHWSAEFDYDAFFLHLVVNETASIDLLAHIEENVPLYPYLMSIDVFRKDDEWHHVGRATLSQGIFPEKIIHVAVEDNEASVTNPVPLEPLLLTTGENRHHGRILEPGEYYVLISGYGTPMEAAVEVTNGTITLIEQRASMFWKGSTHPTTSYVPGADWDVMVNRTIATAPGAGGYTDVSREKHVEGNSTFVVFFSFNKHYELNARLGDLTCNWEHTGAWFLEPDFSASLYMKGSGDLVLDAINAETVHGPPDFSGRVLDLPVDIVQEPACDR